jgi:hypothetical protein
LLKIRIMKKIVSVIIAAVIFTEPGLGQVEPGAGQWQTWFIKSGQDYRLPPPPDYRKEVSAVLLAQREIDSAALVKISRWNAGSPGYHWQHMMSGLWMSDTSYKGALANMLLGVTIYDATVAAWHSKYAFNRRPPYDVDKRIVSGPIKLQTPSYPCEYSVAAGVAATIISHFYPAIKDSVHKMAKELMWSRVAAGTAFPSDTEAGFDLGARIANAAILHTKGFTPTMAWNGIIPQGAGFWKGSRPMAPLAGLNKTVVLDSGSQFRPAPPPDYTNEMAELKNHKPNFGSMANAFFFASQSFWDDLLDKKIFEHNLHLNAPRAARIYAITSIGYYDGYTACWDAKYAYWGIRPDQFDTTFRPVVLHTPPFPGYPSGHAALSGVMAGLYTYFFPEDAAYFSKSAGKAAESRFHAGIHFRSDNEVGLLLGKKVATAIVNKVKKDGADKIR